MATEENETYNLSEGGASVISGGVLFAGNEDFDELMSDGWSPTQAKIALKRNNRDLKQAKAWLNAGKYEDYEKEEPGKQHVRLRKASTWDPNLTAMVANVDNYIENDEDLKTIKSIKGTPSELKLSESLAPYKIKGSNLKKKSPAMLKGWQDRWFYLFENLLDYYKEGQPIQKNTIDLLNIAEVVATSEPCCFNIMMNTSSGSRVYELKAENEQEKEHWMKAIHTNIYRITDLGIINNQPADNFQISGRELHLNAHTGDILLFNSKNAGGSLVQMATSSKFDHVGLLIKHGKQNFSVLEALGKHGVQLFKWSDFLHEKWYDQYNAMAIRRLYIPDKKLRKHMLQQVAKFVKNVVNCSYSWTPMKMMRRQSTYEDLSERTYFCSELIAKAYKLGGLLRDDCPSTAYVPSHFDEEHDLHLLQGCKLLKEQIIDFTIDEINTTN